MSVFLFARLKIQIQEVSLEDVADYKTQTVKSKQTNKNRLQNPN